MQKNLIIKTSLDGLLKLIHVSWGQVRLVVVKMNKQFLLFSSGKAYSYPLKNVQGTLPHYQMFKKV